MSNSALATYAIISPQRNSPRNHVIDTITIHCMAGQMTARACADMFYNGGVKNTGKASANYCVGYDGSIAMSVPESDRSWCSSSGENDHRAITIEVASDSFAPYTVKDAAYNAMLKLIVDICKRNNIKRLKWSASKTERVNHTNGCNMTVHCDYANKACPGKYLLDRMPAIASYVNAQLNAPAPAPAQLYRVRRTWKDAASQVGAYSNFNNAKMCADKNPGYSVYDSTGKAVYTAPKKSVTEIAKEVIAGKWGNGSTRKTKLQAAGYDYNEVQAAVNKLLRG